MLALHWLEHVLPLRKQSCGMQASSCTIVSEKFRQEAPKLLQARYMKTLLVRCYPLLLVLSSLCYRSGSKLQASVMETVSYAFGFSCGW